MKGLFGLVVVVVVLGVVAWVWSPALRAKAEDLYQKRAGWTEDARRKDPVGYFDFAIDRLKKDTERLEDIRGKLSEAEGRLEMVRLENRDKIQQAGLQAEGLKGKYLEAKEKNVFPLVYVDRQYSEQDVLDQIKIWLGQKKAYETIVSQAEKALAAQKEKRNELVNRIAESKGKIPMLESQRTIVQMDKVTAETESMMAKVDEVLELNAVQLRQKNPVRTVEEIMADTAKASGTTSSKNAVADKEVAEFLSGGAASRPPSK